MKYHAIGTEDFYHYIGINIVGGLIPILVACWQFGRVYSWLLILTFMVATLIYYYSIKVIPSRGIVISIKKQLSAALLIALISVCFGTRYNAGAIAYGGMTLGVFLGADLLHLKDLKLKQSTSSGIIGAAGLYDGIATSGLYVLLLTEPIFYVMSKLTI